jgi:hypothetical protein
MGYTDVGAINEAEKVEQGDRGNHIEVNFPPKPPLGFGINLNKRTTVPDSSLEHGLIGMTLKPSLVGHDMTALRSFMCRLLMNCCPLLLRNSIGGVLMVLPGRALSLAVRSHLVFGSMKEEKKSDGAREVKPARGDEGDL